MIVKQNHKRHVHHTIMNIHYNIFEESNVLHTIANILLLKRVSFSELQITVVKTWGTVQTFYELCEEDLNINGRSEYQWN